MKYKVGDVVKVKEGLVPNKQYGGNCFVEEMEPYKQVTIADEGCGYGYAVEENDKHYTEEMLGDVISSAADSKKFWNGDIVEYVGDNDELKGVRAVVSNDVKRPSGNITIDFGPAYWDTEFRDGTQTHDGIDGDKGSRYFVKYYEIKMVTPVKRVKPLAIGDLVKYDNDCYPQFIGMLAVIEFIETNGTSYTIRFINPSAEMRELTLHDGGLGDGDCSRLYVCADAITLADEEDKKTLRGI